jgi:TRAP-type C4-dicarboxylate transport system permease small subunit
MSNIRWVTDKLWNIIDVILAALMMAMIVLVFTNVVLRYGFSSGLRPSVELSRLGFVWVVMLGAVTVLRRGEHLAVTEFTEALFPQAVPYLRKIIWLIILVSVSMLFWGSWEQTVANWQNISQLTGLPTGLFYLAGAISGVLMALIALVNFFGPLEHVDKKDCEI